MLGKKQYLASDYQHTLKDSITTISRGLHSDLQAIMTLMPAEANSGYEFICRDFGLNTRRSADSHPGS